MDLSYLIQPGKMFVGCNYWASHAGMFMWRDWRADVVEDDFKHLAENDIRVLRVFPLWPDFQPLRMHRSACCDEREMRLGEEPLPFTEAGRAGLDETMLGRFREFLDLAAKYQMRLVIGLVTGWMSGRMFAPEAFEGKNLLTDPQVIKWQIKFVRYMVKHFHRHPAVAAWDLGNECNCMGRLNSADEAYVWASTISMAIKTEDQDHPVVSGMHSLSPTGNWRMQDQGEFLDVLTTHPYPIFTPHCATDPLNRMKSALHATAESVMYRDLGGIPCFVEEAGTTGPMVAGDKVAAEYAHASLFTVWAHRCHGFVWWCANEQLELTRTPYDWNAVERELGLFRQDKTAKPILEMLRDFGRFTEKFGILPAQKTDAVCVLTERQDTWAVAYGSFILAKQLGLNLQFVYVNQPIPQADFYLLPSLSGDASFSRHTLMDLLNRTKNGATLLFTMDNVLLSPFSAYAGLEVQTREVHPDVRRVNWNGTDYTFNVQSTLHMTSVGAKVLATDDEGDPFFTVNEYGKGKVYVVNAPIEWLMGCESGLTDGKNAQPYRDFYAALGMGKDRVATQENPTVGLTLHEVSDTEAVVMLVNYEPKAQRAEVSLKAGWKAVSCESVYQNCTMQTKASGFAVDLPNNTGAVIRIAKA